MGLSYLGNIGSFVNHKYGNVFNNTAGAGNDNALVYSGSIDRSGYMSGVVEVAALACISPSQTATLSLALWHCSTTGGTYTLFKTLAANLCIAGAGTATKIVQSFPVDLTGANQFIEAYQCIDLSAAAGCGDNITGTAVILLGGSIYVPTK